MYVGMYVCLCDYSHTVQPRTFKFWHNIPYVNILKQFSQIFENIVFVTSN